MDDVIAFVTRALADEHSARLASDEASAPVELAETRAPRPLLQLDRYRRPDGAELWHAQVGAPLRRAAHGGADRALFLARTDGGDLAVVAVYSACRECAGGIGAHASIVVGARCPECGGRRWLLESGHDVGPLGTLGPPVETRRLVPPDGVRGAAAGGRYRPSGP